MTNLNDILEIDIAKEFETKNYDSIIDYVNKAQRDILHDWLAGNSGILEQLILANNHILNFWSDSLKKKRWLAILRLGSLIGTIETIEKQVYENNMRL